jgi:predicted PurR-regulated permease PerM
MPLSFTSEQKQTWLWLAVGLALVAMLVLLGPVLSPFLAAAILAYALNPAVDWLSARKIGKFRIARSIAVMIVMLLLLAMVLAIILIVIPVLQKELPLLQERLPNILARLDEFLAPKLQAIGIKVNLDFAGIKQLLSQKMAANSGDAWTTVLSSVRIGGTAILGWLATLFLIPMVLFYLLLDWHPLLRKVADLVPRRWTAKSERMAREVDGMLGQYLRGQLLVMLILAIYYSMALTIAGFDVALPVGIITGLLAFIPYLGFGLGLTLALITAVLQFSGWYGLIAVAIIYGLGQVLESFILTPNLVGERIGLHPLVVIFALLAFGQLFGFAGVLLALPATAIVSVAIKHFRAYYVNSSFYNRP